LPPEPAEPGDDEEAAEVQFEREDDVPWDLVARQYTQDEPRASGLFVLGSSRDRMNDLFPEDTPVFSPQDNVFRIGPRQLDLGRQALNVAPLREAHLSATSEELSTYRKCFFSSV
jgi:hypothetical protein